MEGSLDSLPQLYHLRLLHFAGFNFKAQQGAHVMEPVFPSGSGIHVNHAMGIIVFHHADMRVSADEDSGWIGF